MAHVLHTFQTGRDETDAVVAEASVVTSQWCSNCGKAVRNSHLCSHCAQTQGHAHPAHPSHYLILMNVIHVIWTCNGCNKSCTELQDTMCYVCKICRFYLCQSCSEPKKYLSHEHDLTKTDVRCIYHGSHGGWKCDCCGGNNGHGHFLPRHCKICKFDLCEKCCQPHSSTLHLHSLYKANTELIYRRFSGGWRCDSCASRFHPTTNKFPYHCDICEFDLCDSCMKITDSKVFRPPNNFSSRSAIGKTAGGYPVTSPEEDLLAVNGSGPVQDDALCIICLTRPKDATIIHGATGHVCCCLDCARKLEDRRDPCPICREPIQMVIRQLPS